MRSRSAHRDARTNRQPDVFGTNCVRKSDPLRVSARVSLREIRTFQTRARIRIGRRRAARSSVALVTLTMPLKNVDLGSEVGAHRHNIPEPLKQ